MTGNPNLLQNIAKGKIKTPVVRGIDINAEELIQKSLDEFENDLRLQASILAREDGIILESDVKSALFIIHREKPKKWISEILILFGGAFFGAGIAGFANEISMSTLRSFWITAYVVLGILGLILIFIAYMLQNST